MLRVEGVTVHFGGVRALDDVGLDVEPGAVTGIIGPNGAGKTTLFDVLTGLLRPSRGRIRLEGRDVTSASPHRRARLGIARTFQRLELFGSLTVFENVLLAAEVSQRSGRAGEARRFAGEVVERFGLGVLAGVPADVLPAGTARLLEVARALATRPRLLLLDEPGAGLDPTERATFADLLDGVPGDGTGVVLVEHDMVLVMRSCQRLHVLDHGQLIASGSPVQIQADPRVRRAYLGPTPSPGGSEGQHEREE
jgi:branched-chain amino acid transport system ATP-binding protein